MTIRRWPTWIPWAITIASLSFGAGRAWGINETGHRVDVMTERLSAHERIPIHPGAATSEIVHQLEMRIMRLEVEMLQLRDRVIK